MDEYDISLTDVMGSTYAPSYDVGPNNDGTYNVPASAQTSNQPWDAAGGALGNYSSDVFGILRDGIGAWSQNRKNQQFLDYQRYEANQGGVFQQGRPTQGAVVTARATGNPIMLMLLIGGAILLLRK